jgi:hypothetical protein
MYFLYVFFIPLYFSSTCLECYLHQSSEAQTAAYRYVFVYLWKVEVIIASSGLELLHGCSNSSTLDAPEDGCK